MTPKTCKKPAPYLHSCGCQKQIAAAIRCCICQVLSTSIELLSCGSQSPWSSSLCQGARLLLSTPTQFFSPRNCLSSVGFDPIFTDGQVSGPLTPPMWCLNAKYVMGWDETPENMFPLFTVLLPRRIKRVHQEDPNQLEGGPGWVVTYILGGCILLLNEGASSRNLESWCLPICK